MTSLRESADGYGRLAEFCPYGIVVEANGRLVYLNPAGASLLGAKSPLEVIGEPVLRFVHPDDDALVKERMARVHAGETISPVQHKLVRLDGTHIEVEACATAIRYRGESAILGIFRDITDHKIKEQALRESEAKFRGVFEGSLDTIAINRLSDGRYVDVNDEFTRITGYTRGEVIGKTPHEIEIWRPREDRAQTLAALQRDGFIRNCEAEFRRKDGSVRAVLFSTALTRAGGEVWTITIARDVTDQREMKKELVAARDQVLEAARLKSAFLANVSHEIRTPLNVITGYCSLLGDYAADTGDPSLEPMVESVERASRRLISTIQGTLDLAALESGTFGAHPKVIEVNEVVREILRSFEGEAAMKGISLELESREPSAHLLLDPYCFSQAVHHLIDNALKFTEQGSVRIRIYRDAPKRLCLLIRDTGIGIAPDFLATMFSPFSQEEHGYTRPFEGVGLGLALARRFLELNGASLSVRSEKGTGTSVTIRFSPDRGPPVSDRIG